MLAHFCDVNGLLMLTFRDPNITISAQHYSGTMRPSYLSQEEVSWHGQEAYCVVQHVSLCSLHAQEGVGLCPILPGPDTV
jgi:hypothetical protein